MIRLFCGYDSREAVGFHVFVSSVIARTRHPVAFIPLSDRDQQDGSNAFTYARYRIAEMCAFEGWAIFADACDMLALGDLAELWALRDERFAVQVVKHDYLTRNPLKYLGTEMQSRNVDYPRKNWSSLMLINCAASEWRTAVKVGKEAHQFNGFPEDRIGRLPEKWNVLIDEEQDDSGARLLHWTAGIPSFPHYRNARRSRDWFNAYDAMSGRHV